MHNYIDCSKLKDFSKPKDLDSIFNDIVTKYKISNVLEDEIFNEYFYRIAEALYFDYSREMANYEAYIEKDMDARILMSLRMSALVPLNKDLWYFYSNHRSCNTLEDIKKVRIQFLKNFNSDYQDLDWQYYFLIKHTWGRKSKNFIFDFEECYADGDWRKQTNPDIYARQFIEAHTMRIDY